MKLGTLSAALKPPYVITGLMILTGDGPPLMDAALAVDAQGKIAGIGASSLAMHKGFKVLDGRGLLAMPGLVNAHTHAAMGFFRGLGHGKDEMIETFLFPAEKRLTPELLAPLSYSYLVAGLKSGVTCFGDHYYFIDGVAKALDKLGVRGAVGETVADLGGAFPGVESWHRARAGIEKWSHSARVTPVVAPHAADTVSPALLKELATFAKAQKLPLHLHLAQTTGEDQRVRKRESKSPVEFADSCGALFEGTLAVHLIAVSGSDVKILKRRGVTAGACPASQIIYEKLAPLKELATAGVPLALGTDCAASNDSSDVLGEAKLLALLLRDRGAPEASYQPQEILRAATLNGAKALGLDGVCGTLTVGKAADVCFLEPGLDGLPAERPDVNVIYSLGARHVRHVVIDGQIRVADGQLVGVHEGDLRDEYLAAVATIKRRLG